MKRIFFVTAMLILTSCTPSDTAIQTALSQTQAAQPTLTPTQTPIPSPTPEPTPTLIPLSELNIEEILLLPGDLPADFTMDQISNNYEGVRFPVSVSPPVQVRQMELRAGIYASEGIVIFLFESVDDVSVLYPVAQPQLLRRPIEEISTVGEIASAHTENLLGVQTTQILFSRCHALVYIDLFSPSATIDTAMTYAERLDERLSELVCR